MNRRLSSAVAMVAPRDRCALDLLSGQCPTISLAEARGGLVMGLAQRSRLDRLRLSERADRHQGRGRRSGRR